MYLVLVYPGNYCMAGLPQREACNDDGAAGNACGGEYVEKHGM